MYNNDVIECLNSGDPHDPCQGEVAYHSTGRGRAFPRCDKHWAARLKSEERINRLYPDTPIAPAGFDPDYCGERWDSDY